MAEIIETTGHVAFSLGIFMKEQWEVGFLEQPIVTFNSCWSGLFPGEFCFQYLCSAAGNCLPQAMRANPELHNQCAGGSSVAHGNKGFFGGRGGALQEARQKIITPILASALFEGVFAT